jgi:hypothetical protein
MIMLDTMTPALFAVILGYIAGSIILISSLPEIVGKLRRQEAGTVHGVLSRGMLVLGNSLWVVAALVDANPAIVTMCGINALLNAVITIQIFAALHRNR